MDQQEPQPEQLEPVLEQSLVKQDEILKAVEALILQSHTQNTEPILEAIFAKLHDMDNKGIQKVEMVGAQITHMKGDKGDRGEKGDKGEKGDRGDSISGTNGRDGKDGKDGKDGQNADENHIIKYVLSQIKVPENGRDGKDGKDGKDANENDIIDRVKKLVTYKDLEDKPDIYTIARQAYSTWGLGFLRDVSDVNIQNPQDKDVLLFDIKSNKWINGNISVEGAVLSFKGRTGIVVPATGDYTTAQVTENTNLYFTNARAIASTLTGYVSGTGTVTATDSILTAIQKIDANTQAKFTLPTFANKSIIFSNGTTLVQDNAGFFYDQAASNFHLGLTPGTSNANVTGVGMELAYSNNTIGGVNLIIGNKSNGTSAFVDLFLQNDLANTAGSHFAVVNLSSSTYNDTTFGTLLASGSQLAIYGTDGNTILGTAKVGGTVQFFTGGTATGNVRLTISDTGISAVVPATFTQGFVATGQASNTISRTVIPAGLNGVFNILSQTQITGTVNTTNGGFYNEFTINFNSTGSNTYAFTNTAGTGAMGLGGSTAVIAAYVQVSNSGSLTDSQVFPALFSLSGAGNITNAVGFRSVTSTATSTGRITNHEGFRAEDQTLTSVVSTNVYGFRGRISSGTNKYNLFMDGTAQNLFAGLMIMNGGIQVGTLSVSGNATLVNANTIVGVQTSATPATAWTITLPSAVTFDGLLITIMDETGNAVTNNITVVGPSAQTINTAANKKIITAFGSLTLYARGGNWFAY